MINSNVYECIFKRFDGDGDGKLSPSELQRCVETIGEELLMEEAEELVASIDYDGDGLLGLEEFVGWMEREIRGDEERKMEELREAFRMYEMEGSKCITPTSLKRMLSRLGESRSVEECCLMIRQFDVNGDGVLSFDEFKLMML